MGYILLLSRRFLFKRKGSTVMACLALAATIFLLIFIGLVFNGVLNGIVRDLGDMRFGDVQIRNNVGSLDIEDDQIIRGLLVNEHII